MPKATKRNKKASVKATPPKKVSVKPRLGLVLSLLFIALLAIGGLIFWSQKSKTLDVYPPTLSQNWRLDKVAKDHQIEGYVSQASVAPGSTINFQISCSSGRYQTDIFRMGGNGASLVTTLDSRECQKQIIPPPSRDTGLVNPDWPTSFRLHVPNSWVPGIYLAKLTASDGYQNYVPFTIESPDVGSRYLFVHALNTDEAYNLWGGNSLYSGYTANLKIKRAAEVSFNRPFIMPSGNKDGSGNFLLWEYPMITFLEQHHYKLDYATDVDIQENPSLLLKYKAVIIAGHDEYWSKQMRDGYINALNRGLNLAVFAANTAYRPIRYAPDPFTGQADRIIVDYKSSGLDPYAKKAATKMFATPYSWRLKPLMQPESEVLGLAYRNETAVQEDGAGTSGDLTVNDDKSWIFSGTGLKNGDKITGLVGYEYDAYSDNLPHPPDVDIVFHSLVKSIYHEHMDFADAGYYQNSSGGQVFDAGTIDWSLGLDTGKPTYSSPLAAVTLNIIERFGGPPTL